MKKVQKITILVLATLIITANSNAQKVGASFSYFLPKNGYFSIPVAPLSFKDLGMKFSDFVGITSGFTLYRFSGMNVKGLPFETKSPIMGPFFATMIPLLLKIIIPTNSFKIELKAGGFAYYSFANHVIYGNLNPEIAKNQGWDIASSNLSFKNKFGFGYRYGGSYTHYINRKLGVVVGAFYYNGASDLNLSGTTSGGDIGGIIETKTVDYSGSQLDFRGLELSFGVDYKVK